MSLTHDTHVDLPLGTPAWFTACAWLLPVGILGQFLSAGFGLFLNAELLGLHAGLGTALSLPVLALAIGALAVPRLRGFGWWAGLVFVLYGAQIALAAGAAPLPMSLHPANGALLLTASLLLLAKVERRRGAVRAPMPT